MDKLSLLNKHLTTALEQNNGFLAGSLVDEIIISCGESNVENYDIFPIDELIKKEYFEQALKLLGLCENEDHPFSTPYDIYIKEAFAI